MWAGNGPCATEMRGAAGGCKRVKGGMSAAGCVTSQQPALGEVLSVVSVPFKRGTNILQTLCRVEGMPLAGPPEGFRQFRRCVLQGGIFFSAIPGEVLMVLMVLRVRFERGRYFSAISDGGGLGVLRVLLVLMVHFKRGSVFFTSGFTGWKDSRGAAMSVLINDMLVNTTRCYSESL